MGQLPQQATGVVIGGGVMGASTAYHLALRGCTDVLLLERQSSFGAGATGKCAGGIRYQFSTEINIRLSQLSLPMLERFEAETGQAIDLHWPGYLFLLTNEVDVAHFKHNVGLQRRLGIETEWLDGDEVRRRIPLLNADDVLAGTFHAGDGIADPNGVVQGYISAGRRLGVQSFTDVTVTGIGKENGKVRHVETSQGNVACDFVVNAAGPWAGTIGELAGISIPIVPVRRQIITTTPIPQLPPDFPFVIDFAQNLYFHPEGKGLLTGQSNPNQTPGFDESVDQEWEYQHLEAAINRLPLLAEVGRLSHWAGLYEVTPDAHPILGAVDDLAGFYIVGGFSGHGFMHGPIGGLLMAEIIIDGHASSLDLSTLDLARFAEQRMIEEYNVI